MKYIIDGKVYNPIKVGDKHDKNCFCPECRMCEGEYHYGYCLLEICPRCKKYLFNNCKCKSWIIIEDSISKKECNTLCNNQVEYIKNNY